MIRYKLKRLADNLVTHAQERMDDIENPWAEFFTDRKVFWDMYDSADAIVDQDGNEVAPARVKNYEVVKEDMTSELAAKAAKDQARADAKTAAQKAKLALVDAKAATNLAQTQAALIKLARVVHNLTKCLDVTDPTEGE